MTSHAHPRWLLNEDEEGIRPAKPVKPDHKPFHALPGQPPPKNPGRRKGTPHRNTMLLRDAVMMAAELAGNKIDPKDKKHNGLLIYLRWLALNEPSSFVTLLNKIIPLQVNATVNDANAVRTRDELLNVLADRGLPVNRIFQLEENEYQEVAEESPSDPTAVQ